MFAYPAQNILCMVKYCIAKYRFYPWVQPQSLRPNFGQISFKIGLEINLKALHKSKFNVWCPDAAFSSENFTQKAKCFYAFPSSLIKSYWHFRCQDFLWLSIIQSCFNQSFMILECWNFPPTKKLSKNLCEIFHRVDSLMGNQITLRRLKSIKLELLYFWWKKHFWKRENLNRLYHNASFWCQNWFLHICFLKHLLSR